jgi:hypothetical protein
MNFGSLHYFLLIKTNGKTFKTPGTVLGQNPARCHSVRCGGLPCEAGRPAGWATVWRPGPAEEASHMPTRTGRADGVVTARSPRTVAHSPMARWWLADGKVLPVSSWGPPGGCWVTRAEAGITEVAGRLRGGVAARCGGTRRGPR